MTSAMTKRRNIWTAVIILQPKGQSHNEGSPASGYQGVEAYFIKVRSKELRGKLFEIILTDYNMILHSTNELILAKLREEGVFSEGSRESVIDGYINQRY